MSVYVTRVRREGIGCRFYSLATLHSTSRTEFEQIARALGLQYWREAVQAAEARPAPLKFFICITPEQRKAAIAAGAIEEDR